MVSAWTLTKPALLSCVDQWPSRAASSPIPLIGPDSACREFGPGWFRQWLMRVVLLHDDGSMEFKICMFQGIGSAEQGIMKVMWGWLA